MQAVDRLVRLMRIGDTIREMSLDYFANAYLLICIFIRRTVWRRDYKLKIGHTVCRSTRVEAPPLEPSSGNASCLSQLFIPDAQ